MNKVLALASPAAILLAALATSPSYAGTSAPGAQTTIAGTAITPVELHRFAAAYRDVTLIRKRLMIATHGMKNEDKIDVLTSKADAQMRQAISAHLSLGEYVRIGRAVNANPELHARFMKIREAERQAPSPASG